MNFFDVLKPLWNSNLDRDAVSLYSRPSCNTGFTGGTKPCVKLSEHTRYRMLERGVDDYLIRHTLARGAKTYIESRGKWKFEKDGVVVIASSPCDQESEQMVVTTWIANFELGFVLEDTVRESDARYRKMVRNLFKALDGDERLEVLKQALGTSFDSIFFGVDLQRMPPDRPLLFHCAQNGYAECVKALLEVGGFNPGVRASKKSTLLHMVAWEGQPEVLDVLPVEVVKNLADIPNGYGEIPEILAWNRHCEEGDVHERYSLVAIRCRAIRVGDGEELSSSDIFPTYADTIMAKMHPLDSIVTIPVGVDGEKLAEFFESNAIFRNKMLIATHQNCLKNESVLERMLCNMGSNFALQEVKLEWCSLGLPQVRVLCNFLTNRAQFHQMQPLTYLSVAHNPIGDIGCGLFAQTEAVLCIQFFSLQDVQLSNGGAMSFARSAAKQLGADKVLPKYGETRQYAKAWRAKKLDLSRNDLSKISVARSTGAPANSDDACGVLQLLKLCGAFCCVTNIVLVDTRLTSNQLCDLFAAIPTSLPSLQTLDITKVSLSTPEAKKKLVQTLRVDGISLKRIAFNRLDYREVWKQCQSALRDRRKFPGAQNIEYLQPAPWFFSLKKPMTGRLEISNNLSRAFNCQRYSIFTRHGAVNNVRDPNNVIQNCVGASRDIEFVVEYDQVTRSLELQAARLSIEPSIELSFRACCPIFRRRSTNEILLIPRRSQAAQFLYDRLDACIFPAEFDMDERFPGAHARKSARPTFQQLVENIDFSTMSDTEVKQLAEFDNLEHFTAFLGLRRIVNESVKVSLQRINQCPQIAELRRAMKAEAKLRCSETKPPLVGLLDYAVRCESSMEYRDTQWYFPPWAESVLKVLHDDCFISYVGFAIPRDGIYHPVGTSSEIAYKDTVDRGEKFFIRLFLINVDEDMIDPDNDLPLGLVMKPYMQRSPPTWRTLSPSEPVVFGKGDFPSLQCDLEKLLFSGGSEVSLVKASQIEIPVEENNRHKSGAPRLKLKPRSCGGN